MNSFLAKIINRIIEKRPFPDSIKCGIRHPIHKKGKVINKAGNYRGITIISIIYKVLDCILARLQEATIPLINVT